ncbi:MAG: hypothetical protein CVV52_02955 [Spirochaetae bacterium HGW-Spirochaetae-8]|jgi:hypothetical protein|nr:MAG: hypothetical protein CVV52_02955 [Spirochaetae bacterium HGW-Spirochaetae-8]
MDKMRRSRLVLLLVCLGVGMLAAAPAIAPAPAAAGSLANPDGYRWAAGVSGISPGLPVAAKLVYQVGSWGVQVEANYFYILGMVRVDGRKTVMLRNRLEAYGFAGLIANHFYDTTQVPSVTNNTLWADVGVGVAYSLGQHRRLVLGAEGGLMIPFLSNLGLEQYENSGFMVANAYLLWRF